MAKIYVLMGKSASGKDTLYERLLANPELALKKVIPYTTRPIRSGEQQGREYYFVDEAELERLRAEGRVIEHREYRTVHGPWHYFTVGLTLTNMKPRNTAASTTSAQILRLPPWLPANSTAAAAMSRMHCFP